MTSPAKAAPYPEKVALNSFCKDQADSASSSAAAVPSLKSSVALSMMQQHQRSPPPLPNLPPAAFYGDYSSMVSSCHDDDDISICSSICPREQNNNLARRMTDFSNDGFFSEAELNGSASTYHHNESGDANLAEATSLAKLMTLQSIDRLEHHLPHIVVDQIIAGMKQRKEDVVGKQHPLARGNLTLEIPMNVAIGGGGSNSSEPSEVALGGGNDHGHTSATATSSRSYPQQQQQQHASQPRQPRRHSGKSIGSTSVMSDLLQTLSSLDELLEEEFSSSEEDTSSEDDEEGDSSSSDDEGSSEEDGSSDDETSSDDDEESDMGASALTFESYRDLCHANADDDDGVSDIGDDGISDIGDSEHLDDEAPVEEDHAHDNEQRSVLRRRAPRRVKSFDSAHNNSVTSGLSGGSGQRSRNGSLRSSGRDLRVAAGELEVGKLRQGRLNNRRLESDTVSDDRSLSVDLATLSTKSECANQSISTAVQATQHQSAILFVDISGFTKLSRSLGVEALSEVRIVLWCIACERNRNAS